MAKRFDTFSQDATNQINSLTKGISDISKSLDTLGTKFSAKIDEDEKRIGNMEKVFVKTGKLKEGSMAEGNQTKVSADQGKKGGRKEKDVDDGSREVYDQVFEEFKKGSLDLAILGFQGFIKRFPESDLVPNAQYWTGECYYAKKDFKSAIEAFEKVISGYPKSDKVAGALLKKGYSYNELTDKKTAENLLKRVMEEYPNSKEAQLARNKLSELR